ncbi:MAG TPA: hypothetical protein VK504_07525 [Vicinamibacterales bacterium]|nr:hypothetical protein [Vicinamibacterales bacterium]
MTEQKCTCETIRGIDRYDRGGVRRDPKCPIHGDGVLKDKPPGAAAG